MKNDCTKGQGFTLLELLVVLAIVGIVSTFAYPSYQDHLARAARSEAMTLLLDAANRQEQYFVDNRKYANVLEDIGVPEKTPNGYYAISVTSKDNEFEIVASAVSGPVAGDKKCTSLKVNHLGQKLSSGSATNEQCWQR